MKFRIPWITCVLCLGISMQPTSQATELPDETPVESLLELQSIYRAKAHESSRVLSEHYLNALAQVEQEAASRADYETALEAQSIRDTLIQSYNHDPASAPLTPTLVIPAHDAKWIGSLTLDRAEGALHNWKAANSRATWDVRRVELTHYQVTLVYRVEPVAGVAPEELAVEFGESSNLQSPGTFPIETQVPLSHDGTWNSATLGTLNLSKRTSKLYFRLKAPSEIDFRLKEVRLTPQLLEKTPKPERLTPGMLSEFDWTQETHGNRLVDLMRPHIQDYKARIGAHLAEIEGGNQPQLETSLRHELKISDEFLAKPANRLSKELSSRLSLRNQALAVHSNARLAAVPNALQGDLLQVQTDQGVITVALQGIELVSPQESDPVRWQSYANYFGISVDQAKELAIKAQELLRQSLQNKTFEICVSPAKESRGFPVVNLFMESRQNLAQLLVSYGVAMIENVPADADKSSQLLREVLLDAEAHAKTAQPKLGAWHWITP